MDRKRILNDIRNAQRCLSEARKALTNKDDAFLLQRISLAAQYAALASHHMPDDQDGVREMQDVWAPANRACNVSIMGRR